MTTKLFTTVASASVEVGPIPFDIYTKDRNQRLVLFCRSGYPITPARKKILKEADKTFYISTDDMDNYLDYAFDRIERIVKSPELRTDEKSQIVYSVGKRIVKQLLDEPRSGQVMARSKQFVESHTRLVLSSPNAASHMFALSSVDSYTYSHSINVCTFSLLIGKRIYGDDHSNLRYLGLGGLLHDIGKIKIDRKILFKPSGLSPEEREIMRKHPIYSYELVKHHDVHDSVLDAVRHHHERMDGSGYPDGLWSEQVPPFARITAVADVYDAITSDRVYQKQRPHVKALALMAEQEKGFDPDAFDALVQTVIHNETLVDRFRKDYIAEETTQSNIILPRLSATGENEDPTGAHALIASSSGA